MTNDKTDDVTYLLSIGIFARWTMAILNVKFDFDHVSTVNISQTMPSWLILKINVKVTHISIMNISQTVTYRTMNYCCFKYSVACLLSISIFRVELDVF